MTIIIAVMVVLVGGFLGFRIQGVLRPGPMAMSLERFFLGNPLRIRYFGPSQSLGLMGSIEGNHVLEVGVGIGVILASLAERVGTSGHVSGLDIQPAALKLARNRVLRAGILHPDLRLGTASALPWESGSFDWVVIVGMLGELPRSRRSGALAEAKRVLGPEGRILITEFWPDPHYIKPQQLNRYCEDAGLHIATLQRHPMLYSVVVERADKMI